MNVDLILSGKYRTRNKKNYMALFSILFLCTFLLSSCFVVKDSYDAYRLNAAKNFYGNYDVKYTTYSYKQNKEYTDTYLKNINYETPLPYGYKGTFDFLVAATDFSVYPIRLIKGEYPGQNEVMIHKKYLNKYKLGDWVTLFSDHNYKEYKISGVYENLNSEFVNYSFYTKANSKKEAMYIYANLTDKEGISLLPVQDYELNSDLVIVKYHLNVEYENVFKFLILFISICCFLFEYSVLSIHLKKKREFYHQLHLLGMNKKRIRLMFIKEYSLLLFETECIGVVVTFLLWGLFLKLLPMHLSLYISRYHICTLVLMLIVIYICVFVLCALRCFFITNKHFLFRRLHLKKLNLSIIEMIRNGNGLLVSLLVVMTSMFLYVSMQSLISWIQVTNHNVLYEHDVSATFNVFDHSYIPEFINSCEDILGSYDHVFNYNINCDVSINGELIETKVSDEYVDFVLTNTNVNQVQLNLYTQGQELIKTLDLFVEQHVENGKNKVLYIPKSKLIDWLNEFPETYITGNLWANTNESALLKKKLDNVHLSIRDNFYVIDNKTDAQNTSEMMNMCQKIIQLYELILILTCAVIVYMQLYQNFYQQKNDYDTLHCIGIPYHKLCKLQVLKLIGCTCFLDFIVLLILSANIKINMGIICLYFIGYTFIYSIFIVVIFYQIYNKKND